jgi:hypothetical protein
VLLVKEPLHVAVCSAASYRYGGLIPSLPALLYQRIPSLVTICTALFALGHYWQCMAGVIPPMPAYVPQPSRGCALAIPPFETTIWLRRTFASGLCRLNLTRAVGLVTSALHPTVASICKCCSRNRPSHGHSLPLHLFQRSYGSTFLASGCLGLDGYT